MGGMTERRLVLFLTKLRTTGSVKAAATAAGMRTNHLYERRKADEEFAEKWQDALDGFAGELHTTLGDAALGRGAFAKPDVRALIAMNRAHNPETFTPRPDFSLGPPEMPVIVIAGPMPARRPKLSASPGEAQWRALPASGGEGT